MARGHSTHLLLDPEGVGKASPLQRLHRKRFVEPDGSMWLDGSPVATFEAKYSMPKGPESTRSHVFQAMTTAAALGSPLSVIVYPERSDAVVWAAQGFDGKPVRVVAVGIDMYGYRRGRGDAERGRLVLDILREHVPAVAPLASL